MRTKICVQLIVIQFAIVLVLFLSYVLEKWFSPFSENSLIFTLLLLFIWIYLSSGLIKIPFYHPYRMFLAIFFLYNIIGFVYYYLIYSDKNFFNRPFGRLVTSFYNDEIKSEVLFSLMFFLAFIHLGVLMFSYFNRKPVFSPNNSFLIEEIRVKFEKIGLYMFYIFIMPFYYYVYVVINEAYLLGGYTVYSLSNTVGTTDSNILIRISDDFCEFGYILLLSTLPKRNKILLPTLLFIFPFLLMSFYTGSRVHLIVQAMVLLTYFAITKMISTKKIVLFISLFAFLGAFLGLSRSVNIKEFKIGKSIDKFNFEVIEDFLLSQGASVHTLGLTISGIKRNELRHSLKFFYSPIIERDEGYNPKKSEVDYYNLADRLSYKYEPSFKRGGGLGSSIVAEFYVYGGVLAICFFSFLGGIFLTWLTCGLNNPFKLLLLLLLLFGIYYTPRAHPLTPFEHAKQPLFLAFLLLFIVITSRKKHQLNKDIESITKN